MRGALVVVASHAGWLAGCLLGLAGCDLSAASADFDEQGRCRRDSACDAGEVCARNGACSPPARLRPVTVTWTISGKTADLMTCSMAEDLRIEFSVDGRWGGGIHNHCEFAPVPCHAGRFFVDKLPLSFAMVRLGTHRQSGGLRAALDAVGAAAFDLPY